MTSLVLRSLPENGLSSRVATEANWWIIFIFYMIIDHYVCVYCFAEDVDYILDS
jgi:hypothetical protein